MIKEVIKFVDNKQIVILITICLLFFSCQENKLYLEIRTQVLNENKDFVLNDRAFNKIINDSIIAFSTNKENLILFNFKKNSIYFQLDKYSLNYDSVIQKFRITRGYNYLNENDFNLNKAPGQVQFTITNLAVRNDSMLLLTLQVALLRYGKASKEYNYVENIYVSGAPVAVDFNINNRRLGAPYYFVETSENDFVFPLTGISINKDTVYTINNVDSADNTIQRIFKYYNITDNEYTSIGTINSEEKMLENSLYFYYDNFSDNVSNKYYSLGNNLYDYSNGSKLIYKSPELDDKIISFKVINNNVYLLIRHFKNAKQKVVKLEIENSKVLSAIDLKLNSLMMPIFTKSGLINFYKDNEVYKYIEYKFN